MSRLSEQVDSPFPELLGRYERELVEASDPDSVRERYRDAHPELGSVIDAMADAIELLRGVPRTSGAGTHPTSEPGVQVLPERFGPFKVIRSIGRGGMGEVYEAIEEPLGRRVAIKTIKGRSISPERLIRFERERRGLALLHHTNIVPIFASGSEGELLYFAMPYLSGASLGGILKAARARSSSGRDSEASGFESLLRDAASRGGFDDPPEAARGERTTSKGYLRSALRVVVAVADALQHAHDRGVVHRDVKPGNIVVERDGHVWLLDFGLASTRLRTEPDEEIPIGTLWNSEGDASLTRGVVGTPAYTAPECRTGARAADPRSDVWGLGATLYELCTLERAFRDGSAVLDSDPAAPRERNPALDRGLEAIILKALRKRPEDRYQTAKSLADDLNRHLRGELVSVWPTNPFGRMLWGLRLWAGRNKGWAAALALLIVCAVGLGVLARERRERATDLERAQTLRERLFSLQKLREGEHAQGWSREILSRIKSMSWSPREKWAVQDQATAALAGLDADTEEEFPGYGKFLAFAPDGKLWMAVDRGGVRLWSPEGRTLESFPGDLDGPLALRGDGRPLQIGPTYHAADDPGRDPQEPRPGPSFPLRVLDVLSGKILHRLADPFGTGSTMLAWAVAPDGSRVGALLVDTNAREWIQLWDGATGSPTQRIAARTSPRSFALPLPGIAFSRDGASIVRWDGAGWVDLRSAFDGLPEGSIRAAGPVHCVAFGRNPWAGDTRESRRIAIGDADGAILLWDPSEPGSTRVVRGSGAAVFCLAFNPEGTLLASAGRTGSHQIWDVTTGRGLLRFGAGDYTTALQFSGDGTRLACGYSNPHEKSPDLRARTRILRLEPGRGVRILRGLPGAVVKVAHSPGGDRVAALSWDWWAAVWDRRSGRLLRLVPVPRGQFPDNADLAFRPDGRTLVVAGGDRATEWEIETGESRSWPLPWGLVEAIAYVDAEHLMLMRSETSDGSRPPDSGAPSADFPRVAVLRNLRGASPSTAVKVEREFNRSLRQIDASPGGGYFAVDGVSGDTAGRLRRTLRLYRSDGTTLGDVPTRLSPTAGSVQLVFDAVGGLLLHRFYPGGETGALVELPSLRIRGTPPVPVPICVGPEARLWGALSDSEVGLFDGEGRRQLNQVFPSASSLSSPVRMDRDGLGILRGDQEGAVWLGELPEIRNRLNDLGLGW